MTSPPASKRPLETRLPDRCGIVVLCGGTSSRMGVSKSDLLIDDETTFLQKIVRSAASLTDKIVIAVAGGATPGYRNRYAGCVGFDDVVWVEDVAVNQGPMEGIHQGLKAIQQSFPDCAMAFVTSCDVPEINGQLISRLLDALQNHDAVTPVDGKRVYGMTAIYRTSLWPAAKEKIETGQLRVSALAASVDCATVDVTLLKTIGPGLGAFANINSPADYFDWLDRNRINCTQRMSQQFPARPRPGGR